MGTHRMYDKRQRFSLRKLSIGIVSVVVGMGISSVYTNPQETVYAIDNEQAEIKENQVSIELHYVVGDVAELTREKQLQPYTQDAVQMEPNVAYYYVYKPDAIGQLLPDTGTIPLSMLGVLGGSLLTLGVCVLDVKRHKQTLLTTCLLISGAGIATVSAETLIRDVLPMDRIAYTENGYLPHPRHIPGYQFSGYYYTEPLLDDQLTVVSDNILDDQKGIQSTDMTHSHLEPTKVPAPVEEVPAVPEKEEPAVVPAPVEEVPAVPEKEEPAVVPAPVEEVPAVPEKEEPAVVPAPVEEVPAVPGKEEPAVVPAPVEEVPEVPEQEEPAVVPAPVEEVPAAPEKEEPAVPMPVYGVALEETIEVIDFNTHYRDNPNAYVDEETIIVPGKVGKQTVTHAYETLDGQRTGVLINTVKTVITPAQDQVIERGTKPIEGIETIQHEEVMSFKTVEKTDNTLWLGQTREIPGQFGRKKVTIVYRTIKGKRTDQIDVQEEILESPVDKVIVIGTKRVPPTLDVTVLALNEQAKTIQLAYTLNNPMQLKTDVVLRVREDDQIVRELPVDVTSGVTLSDLAYYTPYVLESVVIYSLDGVEQTEIADTRNVEFAPKNIELKSITDTMLVKREADGSETVIKQLTEIPENLSNYYLNISSERLNNVILPVERIEEVKIGDHSAYQIRGIAPSLVHKHDGIYRDGIVAYVERYKAPEEHVYYNFKDLITDMRRDPSGVFYLGKSIEAMPIELLGESKAYIPGAFTGSLIGYHNGKRHAIIGLTHPLFDQVVGGTIRDIDFKDVHIVYPDNRSGDSVATLAAELKDHSVIENVNVTGHVEGRDHVAGFVNRVLNQSRIENVSFKGVIRSHGGNSISGGIAGQNKSSVVTRAFVDADMHVHRSNNSSLLVGRVEAHYSGLDKETWGRLTHSVAKGRLSTDKKHKTAAISASVWPHGTIDEVVSYATVINGEALFGSNQQVNDRHQAVYQGIKQLFGVQGASVGDEGADRVFERLTAVDAADKVESYRITAPELSSESLVSALGQVSTSTNYAKTVHYRADYHNGYLNIERLLPFYNREWIVKETNRLMDAAHATVLNEKTIQAVVPMKDGQFVLSGSDINQVLLHFDDGTKAVYTVSGGTPFADTQIQEYVIDELGISYTPDHLVIDIDAVVAEVNRAFQSIELYSDAVYQTLGLTGDQQHNEEQVKRLFLDELFTLTKEQLPTLLTKLIVHNAHYLDVTSEVIVQHITDQLLQHKEAILMGLTYLNRYYDIDFGAFNIKELIQFRPDFYGKGYQDSLVDRLVAIGGAPAQQLKGIETFNQFSRLFEQETGHDLFGYLNYNRQLFTDIEDMNDWFKQATEGTIDLIERPSLHETLKGAKYRVYDNLKPSYYRYYILPLLNLREARLFILSNYSAMTFGSTGKRGMSYERLIQEANRVADMQRDFVDAWYTLASDETKQRLVKEVVIPTWEGFNVHNRGWIDSFGYDNQGDAYAPAREFYNVIGRYYRSNGNGAYANGHLINFVVYDYLDDGGHSIWTHEMTHNYDGAVFLGGYGRRSGVGAEAYAQGLLQSPAPNAAYGGLGINMTFTRPNNGNQIYNTDPKLFKTQAAFDQYMKGYNDAYMLLDYLEGETVIEQGLEAMKHWYKVVDKRINPQKTVQVDVVRHLTEDDWANMTINTVHDLVDHQLMVNTGIGNGTYDISNSWNTYVAIPHLASIYGGGNNDVGVPGAVMFKHNAFRIWGYFGYEKGFVGYASNKYKELATAAGHQELSDHFAIQQLSDGRFDSIEAFKKAYFDELYQQLQQYELIDLHIGDQVMGSYASLKEAFKQAVQSDVANRQMKQTLALKERIFKALLHNTNNFSTSIFKR